MRELSRRQALALGAAVVTISVVGIDTAFAAEDTKAMIDKFTGGKAPGEGGVTISAPEIAENGNTVPISISVDSDMTPDSYVKRVLILADGNPRPGVATFNFTPASGKAEASTRIRLAKTQNVVAVAEMSDGSFKQAMAQVKVTIGGCGG